MKTIADKIILSCLAVLAPVRGMVITCLLLIVVDLITGIMAAHKKKKPITSAGFRRTVVKVFVYEMAILTAFLTQTYLTGADIPVSSIVAGFIGLTELTSILENLNKVSDNKLLSTIISKLGSINDKKDL